MHFSPIKLYSSKYLPQTFLIYFSIIPHIFLVAPSNITHICLISTSTIFQIFLISFFNYTSHLSDTFLNYFSYISGIYPTYFVYPLHIFLFGRFSSLSSFYYISVYVGPILGDRLKGKKPEPLKGSVLNVSEQA